MVDQIILNKLIPVIGNGMQTSKGNWAFFCPICKHHKRKLEINLDTESSNFQSYQCWVCSFRGKNINSLFKRLKVEVRVKNTPNSIKKKIISEEKISLPEDFIPINVIRGSDINNNRILLFLKKRGLSNEDIIRYNIGYCMKGEYASRIIIPSYDADYNLNFFTSRVYGDNSYNKYKNPPLPRDIIFFESFVNWNLPIILCEGPFDSIAIRRNSIPLMGKVIQPALMKKLITSSVKKIYISLDKDAMKASLNFCEQLINENKEVYLVELTEKDPSELGFENFTKIIQKTVPLTFSKLLEQKLKI